MKKFGEGTQSREVSDIFIHPRYNYSVYFNDIAVLRLASSVDFTNNIRPCCLWEDGVDIKHVLNKLGSFRVNTQSTDSILYQIFINVNF